MSLAYYNEHDSHAAAWLRNLIAAGHIAPGVVDERDIRDIRPEELIGFTQCHFFAGIGIWSHALRRAGWPDDRPIWTGSCPCQPFSAAGRSAGFDDERHLWPHWHWLVSQCRPAVVVGEQVASKDGLGWLDLVSADMEGTGYAFGASDLCAAGFQQAHLRQRLYFVGLADSRLRGIRSERLELGDSPSGLQGPSREQWVWADGRDGRGLSRMADPSLPANKRQRPHMREVLPEQESGRSSANCAPSRLADSMHPRRAEWRAGARDGQTARSGADDGLADSAGRDALAERQQHGGQYGQQPGDRSGLSDPLRDPGQIAARWFDVDWLLCRNPAGEPSWRPVESGTFPLAHGVPGRMGKLRAYGNALDAETATGFCQVVRELIE